ncbi:P-loop containing nucleoside triphosphate hydrolase protein [Hyaloraphidium curvatum]|nr:P-loop containing nucleoside triphosphate hydrolase protein [Hyaloraphidium curvatum]
MDSPSPARSLLSGSLRRHADGRWFVPGESDDGSVEYKVRLVDVTPQRLEHLVTQLRWRLSEGNGHCLYELGVADSGELVGLAPLELDASLGTLRRMCAMAGAEVRTVRRRPVVSSAHVGPGWCRPEGGEWEREVAECTVRRVVREGAQEEGRMFTDVRVAVVGGPDAGKSTLIGVLSHGQRDNARGRARLGLLRHPHEVNSGRTSSLSSQLIGFAPDGALLNYASCPTRENVVERSRSVVELLDTCGHRRYLRTTVSALVGRRPDYACAVVPARARDDDGAADPAGEIVALCAALGIPCFVVVSKADAAPADDAALAAVQRAVGADAALRRVRAMDEVSGAVEDLLAGRSLPVFCTSSVTGENLDLLTRGRALSAPSPESGSSDPIYPELRPRKGQILLRLPATSPPPSPAREFDAEVEVLHHSSSLSSHGCSRGAKELQSADIGLTVGATGVADVGTVRQSAAVVSLRPLVANIKRARQADGARAMPELLAERMLLRGEKGVARIRFAGDPEWLARGWDLVFRSGRTLVKGTVLAMVH